MGLELRHLQELKWGVLSTEDSSHPWVFGVEMGLVGGEHLQSCYQLDSSVVTLKGGSKILCVVKCT